MAWSYLLLIKMHVHRMHLFCHKHSLDLKMENSKSKVIVAGEIGIFIFSVIMFDFEKALNRWQVPALVPQGDLGSGTLAHKAVEWREM